MAMVLKDGFLYEIAKAAGFVIHKISLMAGLVKLQDLIGSQRSVAVSSDLSLVFKDGHGSQRWHSLRDCKGGRFCFFTRYY